jgi:mannose-6-phosphate isomerase
MTIELARVQVMPKPWGVACLLPWNSTEANGLVGEIWFQRPGNANSDHALLLKLLFTSEPLSIQVHPDDAYAQSVGLACGKSEAWYILSAVAGAKVALGLKRNMAPQQLRAAINDGSIVDLMSWQTVSPGDVVCVPAGTIHAIGAGLVIAEIQQRTDATFRLFDFGRQRELHIESGIAVAHAGPADAPVHQRQLTGERTLLMSEPHFSLERIELAPDTTWSLQADRETWFFVLDGHARAGPFDVATGDTVFAQSDLVNICAGSLGLTGLVAYAGKNQAQQMLERVAQPDLRDGCPPHEKQFPTPSRHARTSSVDQRMGAQ